MACQPVNGVNQCVDTAHLVTVYGQGFLNGGTASQVVVKVNGQVVTNLNVLSTQLTFNTPEVDPNLLPIFGDVFVKNPAGETATLTNGFEYRCPSNLCANINDTNFEESNACAFVTAFPGCEALNLDTDKDGFSDDQENAHYIDLDCDNQNTAFDLQLPGSDKNVKDIYIAYDWMSNSGAGTHSPFPNADHRPHPSCKLKATNPAEECSTVYASLNLPWTECPYQPSFAAATAGRTSPFRGRGTA